MASDKGYKGFISCRGPGKLVAEELARALEGFGWKCAWWEDLETEYSRHHIQAALSLIGTTNFSVVLLGPGFTEPGDDDNPNWQFEELQEIQLKPMLARRKKSSEPVAPYRCFVVFLSESEQKDFTWYRDAIAALPAERSEEAAVYDFFSGVSGHQHVVNYSDPASVARRVSIMAAAVTIAEALQKDQDAVEQERKAAQEAAEKARLAEVERAARSNVGDQPLEDRGALTVRLMETYLERSVQLWRKGVIPGEAELKPKGHKSKEPQTSPSSVYKESNARVMELEAERAFTSGSRGDGSRPTQPIANWLLAPQPGVVYVTGEAGAGKSTVLASAALSYAARRTRKYRNALKEFSGSGWLAASDDLLPEEASFFPIALCVTRIAAHLSGEDDSESPFIGETEFFGAVLECLKEIAEKSELRSFASVTPDDLSAFCKSHRIVLLLDGLDEVSSGMQWAIQQAASDLFWALQRDEDERDNTDRFRLIFSSRPGLYKDQEADVHLRLLAPELHVIKDFVRRYAGARMNGQLALDEQAKLMARVAGLFGSRRFSEQRTVQRPLFLNLFCWHYCTYGGFSDSLEYCAQIIEHLTEGRNFDAIASRLQKVKPSAAEVKAAARQILGWLAVQPLNQASKSNSGQSSLKNQSSLQSTSNLLSQEHERFGLRPLSQTCATEIIEKLAKDTNLFATVNGNISFSEHLLFRDYLISEAVAEQNPFELLQKVEPNVVEKWGTALAFAETRIRRRMARTLDGVELHPFSGALVAKAAALSAQAPEDALKVLKVAIKVLDENRELEDEQLPDEVLAAVDVYRSIRHHLSSRQRDEVMHDLLRLGMRDDVGAQRRAVQLVFDALLEPRRHWVECSHPDLPEGFLLGDAPVHAAAFQLFCQSEDALDPEFWPHVPNDPDLIDPRTTLLGTPQADQRAVGMWVAQAAKPGGPVGGVNWFEAVAYCLWVTRQLREESGDRRLGRDEIIRLPTPSEWLAVSEVCARGATFPFGEEINDEVANTGFLKLDGASPAGVFPPLGPGLYDWGSNVRCWTTAHPEAKTLTWPPKPPRTWQGIVETDDKPMVGGGDWACESRGYFRAGVPPQTQDPFKRGRIIGFRLVRAKRPGATT